MADTYVHIVGNLTRAPELRFTQTGKPVCNLGVAVNRLLSKPGEERREEVSYFNVTAWDSLGQNVALLKTGDRIMVSGRLQQRSWETEEGDKRSAIEIVADEIGPSLRWASAEVTRNTKGSASEPVSVAAGHDSDEEPF